MARKSFIGSIRKVDPMGRISIPYKYREYFDIEKGDSVELYVDKINDAIYIKKYNLEEERGKR